MQLKTRSKLFLILPVLLVVFASGCTTGTGGTGTGGSQGVVIQEWLPDQPVVDSFDSVRIAFKVKNLGGAEAKDVEATLTGVDASEWGVFDPFINLGDLLPADPRYGTEGAERTAFLGLEAPELAEGIFQQYHPRLRISYEYTTSASKTITIVGESELRRLELEGRTLPVSSTVSTSGPISVDVQVGNLIKAAQSRSGRTEFPLVVRLRNVGGGTIQEKESIPGTEIQFVSNINLDLPSGLTFTDDCRNLDRVEFFRGQEADITCNVEITDPNVIAEEKTFRLELGYDYFVEADARIDVRGTEEPTIRPPGGAVPLLGFECQACP